MTIRYFKHCSMYTTYMKGEEEMAPKVKYTKEEIVAASLEVARKKGIEAVTAREVAAELNVSPRPIFTWFDSMDELKVEVYNLAKEKYRKYIEKGLKEKIPFLGVGKQFLMFAKKEPEMFKLIFLARPKDVSGGAMDALKFSQDLVRESVMQIYNMDAKMADNYFRDLYLTAFALSTMLVTDDSPYTDDEMEAIFTEVSISICKAYKEIPGLHKGKFNKDKIFKELVKK